MLKRLIIQDRDIQIYMVPPKPENRAYQVILAINDIGVACCTDPGRRIGAIAKTGKVKTLDVENVAVIGGAGRVSLRKSIVLANAGAVASDGSKGDSYYNAMAESVIGPYKTELVR